MPFIVVDPATAAAAPAVTIGNPKTSVGMTRLTMETELGLMILRPDMSTARLREWINQAYFDLTTAVKFEELVGSFTLTGVADQPFYTLPAHLVSVLGVFLQLPEDESTSLGYPLDKVDLTYMRKLADAAGDPKLFTRTGQILVTYPTLEEARTITVEARFRPIALTADTHSPVIGQEWHEGILLLARVKAHKALHEWAIAKEAEDEWTTWMRRREDPAAADDEHRIIRSAVPHKIEGWGRNNVIGFEGDEPW